MVIYVEAVSVFLSSKLTVVVDTYRKPKQVTQRWRNFLLRVPKVNRHWCWTLQALFVWSALDGEHANALLIQKRHLVLYQTHVYMLWTYNATNHRICNEPKQLLECVPNIRSPSQLDAVFPSEGAWRSGAVIRDEDARSGRWRSVRLAYEIPASSAKLVLLYT